MANVSLGEHFEDYVKRQVEAGRYTNISEVIRDALRLHEGRDRLMEAKLDALRQDIAAGTASLDVGKTGRSVDALLADFEASLEEQG